MNDRTNCSDSTDTRRWLSLLGFSGDKASIEGLKTLAKLQNLQILILRSMNVSDDQLVTLQTALPSCEIVR